MGHPNFFAELKRRNVYKVAVAYAVVAWLLIQAASILFPTFEMPAVAMKLLVFVLVAGFVVAVVVAWAFEMTPEGMKRTENLSPDERLPYWSRRKYAALVMSVAAIAAALWVFQLVRAKFSPAPGQSEAATAIPTKSIAVLPFDNLSRDPDNAFFAEGVQDEILTRLAKVADLKVIARTSTQKFKSVPANLPDIARQLGVAHLLEGSVQKAGDQVRVNVQLINALSETHLWAETYDRKLTDIFAVESEIAKTIADRLQAQLTGSEKTAMARKPTVDPEAYEFYMKGRHFWNRRTEAGIRKAMELFQQAIAKDPSYALAYAGLADCESVMPNYSDDPPKPHIDRGIVAARRALELDNTLAEAHTALGNGLVSDLQFAGAEAAFKRAFELNPNYASGHQWYGETLQSLGRFGEAIAELRKARELDPLSLIINAIFAGTLYSAGKYDEALQQAQRAIDLDPNFGVSYWVRAQIFESKGDFEAAIADYKKSGEATPSDQSRAVIACAYARSGKVGEARKILDAMVSDSQRRFVSSYWLAVVQAVLGNGDEAIRLLEKAFDERSIPIGGGGVGGPKIDNRFDSLRADPRFQKLLARFMGETK
jgi:TolB-like protein/Tfp pilus assembly protein PilF